MKRVFLLSAVLALSIAFLCLHGDNPPSPFTFPIDTNVPGIASDPTVVWKDPIVYCRVPRDGKTAVAWADIAEPRRVPAGTDLVMLSPDGTEQVLVDSKGVSACADLQVMDRPDGIWVYYTFYKTGATVQQPYAPGGCDCYKINVATKEIRQLTFQDWTPTAEGAPATAPPIYNMHPCPLPNGRFAFISSRNFNNSVGEVFAADDDTGLNCEQICFFNLHGALHPFCLMDGRIIFSSHEDQGTRSKDEWGTWAINPDGANFVPMVSAFIQGGAHPSFHFHNQLSDGSVVQEMYYIANAAGFGTLFKYLPTPTSDHHNFGPGYQADPRNVPIMDGWPIPAAGVEKRRWGFEPYKVQSITTFAPAGDYPGSLSDPANGQSARLGKFTHPAAFPGGHLLCSYSPGDAYKPFINLDAGIYLIRGGNPIYGPSQMLCVKNDPNYHEIWPRTVSNYQTVYGMTQPKVIPPLANDGSIHPALPAGTPFALVGTSSNWKRESFPSGVNFPPSVTSEYPVKGQKWWTYAGQNSDSIARVGMNRYNQGGDMGLVRNEDIVAFEVVAQEPVSAATPQNWSNLANAEQLRILGQVPLRKFVNGVEPLDPDGNPDTSVLFKIPANTPVKFRLVGKSGEILVDGQTWHAFPPGTLRNDCGGCHAHSQQPTDFSLTMAAKPDYKIFDLTDITKVPMLTEKAQDQLGKQITAADDVGVKYVNGLQSPEWNRDIMPILNAHCTVCHSTKAAGGAPMNLAFDDPTIVQGFPLPYYQMVRDSLGQYGMTKSLVKGRKRYVNMYSPRESGLAWKIFGGRMDGILNTDWPYEATPGDPTSCVYNSTPATAQQKQFARLAYIGTQMPPPASIADGTTTALSDDEKRTIYRWIGLGCPIELKPTHGWFVDQQKPILTMQSPQSTDNPLSLIRIGAFDYNPGLDLTSFSVTADFVIDGIAAGQQIPGAWTAATGVWSYTIQTVIANPKGTITVTVKDKSGNRQTVRRTFRPMPDPCKKQ